MSLRGFYRRRAWRLLPAMFVLLALFLAASIVIGTALKRAIAGVAAGVFYCMNFVLAAGNVDDMPFGLTHLWSLAAEEQFYVVWPLLLLLVFRARISLAIAACTVAVVLMQLRAIDLLSDHASGHRVAFGVDTRSMPIIAGCLLALLWSTSARGFLERHTRRFEALAVALFLAVVIVAWGNFYFAGPLLIVALCSCLLIARALDPESHLARALSVAPMVFLGRISYSLYLWHVPDTRLLRHLRRRPHSYGRSGHRAFRRRSDRVVLPCRVAFPAAQAACRIGDRADNELDPAAFAPEIAAPRRSCGRSPALGVVSHIRVAQTRALALFLPGQIMGETRGTRYAATAPRRKSTISLVVAPGPKTSATPSDLSSSASS